MKYILFNLVLVFFLIVGCKSASERNVSPEEIQKKKETIAKLSAIDEQLEHFSTPDEVKLKLKMEKARILMDGGSYDEAVVLLQDVLKTKSEAINDSEVNLYLGKAYYGKSDYSNAINYLSNSEKLDRDYNQHERKKMIARSLYEEEEYYPALAALGKAYRAPHVKKDIFFYETAAEAYYKMAFSKKSIEHYKKARQVSELGLKQYPESSVLKRIHKESLDALGPIHK